MKLQPRAFSLLLLGFAMLGLTSVPILPRVQAHAPGISLSAYTSSPPSIDGVIGVSEWANAAKMNFTGVNKQMNGAIYVMNDAKNLYLAVKITSNQLGGNSLDIYFDNNHNGTYDVGEKDLTFYIGMTSFDRYVVVSQPGFLLIQPDINDGGTTDGSVAATNDGTYTYYEFSTPLCSADTKHDFCLTAGDTVGFNLIHNIFGDGGDAWPAADAYPLNDASHWGDIKVAPAVPMISVTESFFDSGANQLILDSHGNPRVNVIYSNGVAESTNPGQILAWTKITNLEASSYQSLRLNQTLPVDWTTHLPGTPTQGTPSAYFRFTNGTIVDITSSTTLTTTTGNPEKISLSISNITATSAHGPWAPGEGVLLLTKMEYTLSGTNQPYHKYPLNYTETTNASAWTMPSFTGGQQPASGSAFFTAYAKVLGDVNGDGKVDILDLTLLAQAWGATPGDPKWSPNLDVTGIGVIDIRDVCYVALYFGNHA